MKPRDWPVRKLAIWLPAALIMLIAALLFWRMIPGGLEMRQYGEQSMVLRIPVWWSFIVILPAMALLVATCAATMIGHLGKARA